MSKIGLHIGNSTLLAPLIDTSSITIGEGSIFYKNSTDLNEPSGIYIKHTRDASSILVGSGGAGSAEPNLYDLKFYASNLDISYKLENEETERSLKFKLFNGNQLEHFKTNYKPSMSRGFNSIRRNLLDSQHNLSYGCEYHYLLNPVFGDITLELVKIKETTDNPVGFYSISNSKYGNDTLLPFINLSSGVTIIDIQPTQTSNYNNMIYGSTSQSLFNINTNGVNVNITNNGDNKYTNFYIYLDDETNKNYKIQIRYNCFDKGNLLYSIYENQSYDDILNTTDIFGIRENSLKAFASLTYINQEWIFSFIDEETRELNKYKYLQGEQFIEDKNISSNWIKTTGNKNISDFTISFS